MMPRLDAREQQAAIRAQGLAFGAFEKADAEQMQRELREAAQGIQSQDEAARPKRATPAQLSAMGIGVSMPVQKGQNDG